MGLDMWFREDCQRILATLAAAGEARPQAYHDALFHVALAFGLVRPGQNGLSAGAQAGAKTWQGVVNDKGEAITDGRRHTVIVEGGDNRWK